MNFANPIFFWVFLSLIPLVAIYLLKVRPNRKPTTAYFLWQDIFQEKRSSSLFQRLRDLFSLLLMILAFAAISLALTKPFWEGDSQKDVVLIIDNSASMNANESGSTRLESAKKIASQIVESLNGTQRCSVAVASNKLQFISNMTDNPRELLSAIDSIEPTVLSSGPDLLNQFESKNNATTEENDADSSKAKNNSDDQYRVIFLSDGRIGASIPDSVELLKIGKSNINNAGIVACDLQRLPGSNSIAVFYQLASTFEDTTSAELVLTFNEPENIVKLIPVEIAPGTNNAAVFELENAQSGNWQLSLEIDDCLETDNIVDLVLSPIKPIEISVAAAERFFYENSVLAFSRSGGLLKLVPDSGRMLIGQGGISLDESDSNPDLLIFKPEGDSPWWTEVGEEIEVTLPRAVDEDHPAIRHIEISSIPFIGAKRLQLPPGAEVWVEAEDETPLIYKLSRSGTSVVVVNLDPLTSNFYFSAWFPVLVYSTAKHLAGRTDEIKSVYPTGDVLAIPGATNDAVSKLITPSGDAFETNSSLTPALNQRGVYQVENVNGIFGFSSSLLSPTETLLNNGSIVDTSKPINRGASPVGLLTILAIIVVICESILYQRRKVG